MSDDSGDVQSQLNLGNLNLSVTKQASLVQSSPELCISKRKQNSWEYDVCDASHIYFHTCRL